MSGVEYLGITSGGYFDCSGLDGYKKLTDANFILVVKSIPATMAYSTCGYIDGYANGGIPDGFNLIKTYNASTGKLTYTNSIRCYADSPTAHQSAYAVITYDLYLVNSGIDA